MKIKFLTLILFLYTITTSAQISGKIDNPYVGISFTIPEGWFGQESGDALLLASNTEVGLMIMMGHDYNSLEQIKKEADAGLNEDGISLQKSGNYENISNNGVGAEFSGYLQGAAAKAFIASLVNPYGQGITVMSITTSEAYTPRHKELALALAKSVKFSKPVVAPIVNEWKEALKNTKLTYLSSYNSSSSGGYGGMSSQEEIHLCAAGYFKYNSNSSVTIDTGGASGYSAGKDDGAGTWEVTGNASGGAALKLKFNNGEVRSYNLSFEDNKTFLNGKRYFKTGFQDDPQYRPDCPR
ncbi:MAG: hypothetical protein IPJ74_14765 [Saprospiraceae bacterium]|nr:hypothetical protein [Saprospiraceae bacterium]